MKLAFHKKQTDLLEQAELTTVLCECRQKQEFLRISVQTLLQFIKEFDGGHILPFTIITFEK